ncbi:hypothetical protein PIB30_089480 [Stylosanthes scabra]|uniref:Uncharacterized protein n=1 Tax=Stylosanthes scabra TaxID=79078 RepID=A0ABU6WU03_9FABA|nr:hypothetical protein [Stylosanthes scabra]
MNLSLLRGQSLLKAWREIETFNLSKKAINKLIHHHNSNKNYIIIGSGVIIYEIEKREKYEDSDEREDADLDIVKTRRSSVLEEGTPLRKDPVLQGELVRHCSTLPFNPVSRLRSPPLLSKIILLTQCLEGERPLKSWELIPPSEGWMCDGDEVEGKGVTGGVPARVDEAKGIEQEDEKEEEDEGEEEEDPEEDPSKEEMPAAPRAIDVDVDDDYLEYLEKLRRHPEYSSIHSSQAYAQNPSDDARSLSSDARSQPSFDLSGIWPLAVGPSQ